MIRASGLVIYRVQPVVEFLLLQTSYGEHHWTPPKGHVDEGEDEMTAALRETEEEAGLKKSHFKINESFKKVLQYPVNGKPKSVTYWLAELLDKDTEVKLSHEHQAYLWCDVNKAKEYAKFEEMKCLFNEAYDFISSNKSSNFCQKKS